jgi:RHS repeat-associated protein
MAKTRFLYFGTQYIGEADETNTVTKRYVNEPDTYTNLIGQHEVASGENRYLHYDALGSTRSVTDNNEVVADTFSYDSWGNVLSRTGTNEIQFQYVGKHGYYRDKHTKTYYVMARAYDPSIIRWLSVDPLHTMLFPLLRESSRYVYSLSRPMRFYDPLGLYASMPNDGGVGGVLGNVAACIVTKAARKTSEQARGRMWNHDTQSFPGCEVRWTGTTPPRIPHFYQYTDQWGRPVYDPPLWIDTPEAYREYCETEDMPAPPHMDHPSTPTTLGDYVLKPCGDLVIRCKTGEIVIAKVYPNSNLAKGFMLGGSGCVTLPSGIHCTGTCDDIKNAKSADNLTRSLLDHEGCHYCALEKGGVVDYLGTAGMAPDGCVGNEVPTTPKW